jgi:hypothetical protein
MNTLPVVAVPVKLVVALADGTGTIPVLLKVAVAVGCEEN